VVPLLGGGPIGCELSQAARLGARDAQVEPAGRLMLQARGRTFAPPCQTSKAVRCELRDGNPWSLTMTARGKAHRLRTNSFALLWLEGYTGALAFLYRTVQTNDYLQTIYPNIYAAGGRGWAVSVTHVRPSGLVRQQCAFGEFRLFMDYSVFRGRLLSIPKWRGLRTSRKPKKSHRI
jgi:hypothetical protein